MSADSLSSTPLDPADRDALDALVDAGFDPEGVPHAKRARARRLAVLLGLLDGPASLASEVSAGAGAGAAASAGAGLVDATMARVLSAGKAEAPLGTNVTELSVADSAALDAMVDSGWRAEGVGPIHSARAVKMAALFANLDPAQAESFEREDLISRTMTRVLTAERALGRAGRGVAVEGDMVLARRPGGFRLADMVSVAAMLFVAASIVWPAVGAARDRSMRADCVSNMNTAALGFSLYGADHRSELPMTERAAERLYLNGGPAAAAGEGSPGGGRWWHVGDPTSSHSANLFVLARGQYVTLGELACAGNPLAAQHLDLEANRDWRSSEEVSYSYQLFGRQKPQWTMASRAVVLTDRSPIVERAKRGERFDPHANSLNHRGKGQTVLFNDGDVEWMETPVLTGPGGADNMWLPRYLTGRSDATLRGYERPDGVGDAFVGP